MKRYPLKFEKIFVEKIWGGRAFEETLHMSLPEDKLYGEAWELSALSQGTSRVAEGVYQGRTLNELVEEFSEEILGKSVVARYGKTFPLLIKYLDINDKLSVQVHPDDRYAMEHEKSFGKAECWYIMKASSDAKLIYGLQSGVSREQFMQKASEGAFEGLFQEVSVKTGDFIYIEPGTVHATLSGSILIAEIQQSSDVTYRIYDFEREDAQGKKRPLHLIQAGEVIAFNDHSSEREILSTNEKTQQQLLSTEYFNVEKCWVSGEREVSACESFQILSSLSGNATITCEGERVSFCVGETLLIPANCSFQVEGELSFLRSTISSKPAESLC